MKQNQVQLPDFDKVLAQREEALGRCAWLGGWVVGGRGVVETGVCIAWAIAAMQCHGVKFGLIELRAPCPGLQVTAPSSLP